MQAVKACDHAKAIADERAQETIYPKADGFHHVGLDRARERGSCLSGAGSPAVAATPTPTPTPAAVNVLTLQIVPLI